MRSYLDLAPTREVWSGNRARPSAPKKRMSGPGHRAQNYGAMLAFEAPAEAYLQASLVESDSVCIRKRQFD